MTTTNSKGTETMTNPVTARDDATSNLDPIYTDCPKSIAGRWFDAACDAADIECRADLALVFTAPGCWKLIDLDDGETITAQGYFEGSRFVAV